MSAIYCLPGLGADHRMFERLLVPGYDLKCLDWEKPEPDESLSHYAERLAQRIDRAAPVILLGVSFGGIMALELSKFVEPSLIVLVSSVKGPKELPWYYRLPGRLRLHRLLPLRVSRFSEVVTRFLNGGRAEEDSRLLRAMLHDADVEFVRWAIDRLVLWTGCVPPGPVVHVHGTSDLLLPIRYVSPDVRVDGGTHVMIVSRAEEISRIVEDLLKENGTSENSLDR